jgi:hypothetical protein
MPGHVPGINDFKPQSIKTRMAIWLRSVCRSKSHYRSAIIGSTPLRDELLNFGRSLLEMIGSFSRTLDVSSDFIQGDL